MAYYRDIYVFLPDIKYGSECKPCCPSCKQRKGVGNNGFRKNHFGRLIVGMDTTYYVITRQYRCYDCERKRNDLCGSTAMEAALRESGVSVEKTVDKLEYTFMAWDKRIIPLYPHGIGMDFPAILTWRAGVDKLVVAMMRPLFNKGVKPASLPICCWSCIRPNMTDCVCFMSTKLKASVMEPKRMPKQNHLASFQTQIVTVVLFSVVSMRSKHV